MVDKRDEARQKLVEAAIACIEEYGIQNATIRRIAEHAGVNSAAISYYFGGRDELIREVLGATLENAFQLDDIEIPEGYSHKEALAAIFEHWLGGALNYPGITRAHLDIINSTDEYREMMLGRMNQFISEVTRILVRHGMADTGLNAGKVRVIFSAVLNSIIMPEVMFGNDGKGKLGEFIEVLVSVLD